MSDILTEVTMDLHKQNADKADRIQELEAALQEIIEIGPGRYSYEKAERLARAALDK